MVWSEELFDDEVKTTSYTVQYREKYDPESGGEVQMWKSELVTNFDKSDLGVLEVALARDIFPETTFEISIVKATKDGSSTSRITEFTTPPKGGSSL